MDFEVLNKLCLELSQILDAKTVRESRLFEMLKEANGMLRTAYQIAARNGEKTNWDSFKKSLEDILKRQHKEIWPAESGGKDGE